MTTVVHCRKAKYDGKWNVMGGKFPNGYNNQTLYSFKLVKKVKNDNLNL